MPTPDWFDPTDIAETEEWESLRSAFDGVRRTHLRELVREQGRETRLTLDAVDLWADLRHHRLDRPTLDALLDVARRAGVERRRDDLFAGVHVNTTEDRAAGHPALRMPTGSTFSIDGENVVPEVVHTRERMADLVRSVHTGEWTGVTGRPIRNVVNVGIGGSDLGPRMAVRALRGRCQPGMRVRWVANVDPAEVAAATDDLDPAETLVVVVSKSFTTDETMTNASSMRQWLLDGLSGDADESMIVERHVVAVSSNVDAATAFGVDERNVIGFEDWVGGRYSMWSAVGLSIMFAIGPDDFDDLLDGAYRMDCHFRDAPLERNLPIVMGMLRVLYRDLYGFSTHAVLPYASDLADFPAHLQQLDMESNGKSVRLDGSPITMRTGPILWGRPGTNGQHAFYQLLHQGASIVPADLIAFERSWDDRNDQQRKLLANVIAQHRALAFGRSPDELVAADVPYDLVPHRTFPGNRPSTLLLADELTPSVLGQLVALYEHIVLVQGVVWGIDSFDQWGVELGKELAAGAFEALGSDAASTAPQGPTRWVIDNGG